MQQLAVFLDGKSKSLKCSSGCTCTYVLCDFNYSLKKCQLGNLPLFQNMYNSLTQLRRMADRCTGANHFAADTLQRQVSRLSSRFSKFEALLDERRRVVNGSVRLHNCVHEVRERGWEGRKGGEGWWEGGSKRRMQGERGREERG